MTPAAAVSVDSLEYSYGERRALAGVSFTVGKGEIFGLLGPNGGGKTTLFRILSTLFPSPPGRVAIFGLDPAREVLEIRRRLGVVFQSPSLDAKLSVRENLVHHGHLYGLLGARLERSIDEKLAWLQLTERRDDRVETLSGGLKRRVELAKGLLTAPQLLILDEPSTGLDPGARRDLWQHLESLRATEGTTILVTTHLTDEAERADRLAILDQGRIVAEGTPDELRRRIGGDIITLRALDPERLAEKILQALGVAASTVDGLLRIEMADGHMVIQRLFESFPGEIEEATVGRPTLEDVFVHETGHGLWSE